ncbi:MAG: TetR/AcrR family transcriptional regulator, partial [Pseudomonadota bacterium]
GWAGLSLTALAERADLPLVDVHRQLPGRQAILRGLSERADEAVLGIDQSELEGLPARDRMFELIMRRFDALAPFRPGLERLARDARRDPCLVLATACRLDRSLTWVQELAGQPSHGLRARVQRRVLMAVYLQALRTWLADDSADLAKTMAELDTKLRRSERFLGLAREPAEEAAGAAESV